MKHIPKAATTPCVAQATSLFFFLKLDFPNGKISKCALEKWFLFLSGNQPRKEWQVASG
jgi:hypothetical protein